MKLSTLILALFTVASQLIIGTPQETFDLIANFREPKNILFACNIGGSSHIVWVLEILEELAARGHHVSFYTRVSVKSKQYCILMILQEDQAKFIKNFPSVELILNGPALFQPEEARALLERLVAMEVVKGILEKEQLILMNIKEGTDIIIITKHTH